MKQPELGILIADLRKKQGLTQEELVDLCNINVRTIQRIEAGEVNPRSYTIKNILEALGTTIDDVFQEDNTAQSSRENNQAHETGSHAAHNYNSTLYLIGGIAGIGYLITYTLIMVTSATWSFTGDKIVANGSYISLNAIYLMLLAVFYYSLYKWGISKNYKLFAYSALAFIGINAVWQCWDVFNYMEGSTSQSYFDIAMGASGLFVYGLGYIFLGIGLFTQRKDNGDHIKWAGIFGLVGGLGFALILLFPVGILCTLIFEILLVTLLFSLTRSPSQLNT